MIHEQLLKTNKQLLKYDHIHMISENKHLPFKSQKELWIKLWSLKKRRKSINFDLMTLTFSSCN